MRRHAKCTMNADLGSLSWLVKTDALICKAYAALEATLLVHGCSYVNPMTVRGFFDVLKVPKDEYLLQSAAGSVLGRMVIQMAKHFDVKTINVVRREEQKEELLHVG